MEMNLLALLGASALAFFGGEVREAATKAEVATPVVEWGNTLPNPAWIIWPCHDDFRRSPSLFPECVARNPVVTVYLSTSAARASRWELTLWAYHEVCHIKLEHRWPVGTSRAQMDRDHRAVRDCTIDLLGWSRYNLIQKFVYGGAGAGVSVRHSPW